jgi:PKD repeat protein
MSFGYPTSIGFSRSDIQPVSPAYSILTTGTDLLKPLVYAYDGYDYNVIGSQVEFGKLTDSLPSQGKGVLLKKYLDLFDVNTEGPWPYFHADTTHICRWRQVKFTDDSFDNVISWQWEFPGGTPSSSTEQNPVVQYHHTGTYDVILTISDGIHSQTMHKKSYIHVHTCTGIDDLSSDRNTITLYPNPVKERVWLRTNSDIVGTISVTFYSIDGKSILVKQFPGNGQESDYSIDLSRISPGIYLVQIRGDRWQEYLKLIVQ